MTRRHLLGAALLQGGCGSGDQLQLDRELCEIGRREGLSLANCATVALDVACLDGSRRTQMGLGTTATASFFFKDGRRFAFLSSSDAQSTIVTLVTLADGRQRKVEAVPGAMSFVVSEDETTFVYEVGGEPISGGPCSGSHFARIIARRKEGDTEVFQTPCYGIQEIDSFTPFFDISPDGSTLAISAAGKLFSVNIASRHIEDLGAGGNPRWSPDGKMLSYRDPVEGLCVLDWGTRKKVPLRQTVRRQSSTPWSPDSRYLLAYLERASRSIGTRLVIVRAADGATATAPEILPPTFGTCNSAGFIFYPEG